MSAPHELVCLFDVDNTLLDNDRVADDLRRHLHKHFGEAPADEYWVIFEALRRELGYADYLGALQRYRTTHMHDTAILHMASYLVDYPFANRLYPGSLDALAHMQAHGLAVILSDGDVVFQPRKIERSGIWEAVQGHVLVYIHKEAELHNVEARYPARHYVMVDDKLRLLTAIKAVWGARVTTVWPRQGHYAVGPTAQTAYPPPDVTLERIGDLPTLGIEALVGR